MFLKGAQTQDIDQHWDANGIVKGCHFDSRQGEGVLFCVAMGRAGIQDTLHDSTATGNRSVKSCGGYPIPLHLATHGPISHFWQPLKTCRDACLAVLKDERWGLGGEFKVGWCCELVKVCRRKLQKRVCGWWQECWESGGGDVVWHLE